VKVSKEKKVGFFISYVLFREPALVDGRPRSQDGENDGG
jgi:hypothetical protein